MFAVVTRPLASLSWHPPVKFSDETPANFAAYRELLVSLWSDPVISFILCSVGAILAIAALAWMVVYFNRKRKIDETFVAMGEFQGEVNGEPTEGLIVGPVDGNGEAVKDDAAYANELTIADAKCAEEVQFDEVLLDSIFTTEKAKDPSSSVQRPLSDNESMNLENDAEDSSDSFCGICLENKEGWQMFMNDACSHSFCYSCTGSHIEAKIQNKLKQIPCPAINCKAVLNFNACRLMIPDDTLVQWDELLCTSLIPEYQKLYCPFSNCSTLLVNDSGRVISEINCVACRRSFCAECHVPWHSEFTCKEFQKLYARQGGKSDRIVRTLAKRKNWQKCPRCRMYVEKTGGCLHISCRCGYEFCYRCGLKWTESHGSCRPRHPPAAAYRRLLGLLMCVSFN